ncbi:hypothetical protein HB780_14555 [Rhizobium lusitanum]|uniref:hypothetical protein n=1 Tax=Rhizobium lusitanum TaxID=293958 RepID=UPI0016224764|nr:hypothetical protein [Rhizobium lusitanum]QND46957.1 hypothetical protein HB780_14555 [Rhizobium lusitanum]
MMETHQALERLQRQLVSMDAPVELRRKIMAKVAVCEERYIPLTCDTLIAALEWFDAVRQGATVTQ